jgi:hypothetical protein
VLRGCWEGRVSFGLVWEMEGGVVVLTYSAGMVVVVREKL